MIARGRQKGFKRLNGLKPALCIPNCPCMHMTDFDNTSADMTTLYDSESFIVVHLRGPGLGATCESAETAREEQPAVQLAREGFEIVDKRASRHVYLDGSWAERFHQQIVEWRNTAPTQEEVEDTLEHYTDMAGHPLVMH